MGNVASWPILGKIGNAGSIESKEYHLPNNPKINVKTFTQRKARKKAFVRWMMCFFIGGLISVIYRGVSYVNEKVGEAHYEVLENLVEEGNLAGAFFANTAIMLTLALTAVSLVLWEPASGGSGIPEVIGFLNGVSAERLMDLSTFIAKLLGVMCAVSSGLFVGPEGPTIHIGALLGAFILRSIVVVCKRFNIFRSLQRLKNDKDERDFVANGAAGGIAAAFHAPIGGVIFALEEAISYFNAKLVARTYLTCAAAYYVLFFLETHGSKFDTNLFTEFQLDLTCRITYYAQDIFWFAILGALGGLIGGVFNFLVCTVTKLRIKYINPLGWRRILEVVAVTCLTSIFVVFVPYNYPCTSASSLVAHVSDTFPYFNGSSDELCVNRIISGTMQKYPEVFISYENYTDEVRATAHKLLGEELLLRRARCEEGTYNEIASLFYVSGHTAVANLFKQGTYYFLSAGTIIAFGVIYFLMAGLTAGTSIASGLVIPTLTIGGCIGRVYSIAINEWIKHPTGQHVADPGTWAMIGAAAFWSGTGRITVTIAVIMLEITGKFRFLPAIMVAVVVAKWVGDWMNHSLYHALLHLKHIPYLGDPHKSMTTTAGEAMVREVVTFSENESRNEIERVLNETTHHGFPVLHHNESRTYMVGLVTRLHIEQALDDHPAQNQIPLCDYMDCTPYTVPPGYFIYDAVYFFKNMGLRHLCVVNNQFELLGILTRKDLDHTSHEHEHQHHHGKAHKHVDHDDHDIESQSSRHSDKKMAPSLEVPLLENKMETEET
ncbi:chloride channel protein D-like [Corticium candelabrum]|uniref:chloride channel protein D-like n=1 Tax=Corticium candelabrum TaxID=121492 RepID=UPI002E272D17|nr:chloride channel protein D-like [Corticium candelabrum]